MFEWINKPEIFWTIKDYFYSMFEIALVGIAVIILFILITKINEHFNNKKGD